MDNAEEILQALEEFSKLKPKEIPKELDEYLGYVAKTGDPVYQWHLVKYLFHEKLLNVITEFYETSPTIDLPPCPNVDPFNYERMKTSLLERLDTFSSAPFTVQRICELLTNPRKQYNRVDKFMRAIEKNILVVSTREPGVGKRLENDQTETVLNGIPDNKVGENDDRIVNVCSDNLQFNNNSADSSQIPVENAVNACVIQEEVEIGNSASSNAVGVSTESKSWCEVNNENDDKKDSDDSKTDDSLHDGNSEMNVVSSTASTTNSELPKSNILFTENEIKHDNVNNVKNSSDNIICNELIVSSTPDSPEPSNSSDQCESDNEQSDLTPLKTVSGENDDVSTISKQDDELNQQNCEVISESVVEENKENREEITESTSTDNAVELPQLTCEKVLDVVDQQEQQLPTKDETELQNEDTTTDIKISRLSPENTQPDSSNDSYPSGGDNSVELNNDIQIESAVQNEDNVSNFSESSSSERISTEITDVTSSQTSVTIQEVDEDNINEEELIVKDVVGEVMEEEDEDEKLVTKETIEPQKSEEIKCSIEAETTVNVITNEESVVSSDECISIEEITEIKDDIDENSAETGIAESSSDVIDEFCEQERREGSIIHVTPTVKPNSSVVEDICVDQSSCSTGEDEAMDVDDTCNQQTAMSEGETEEPMDQSEQSQS
ncbi:uncharacterized protein LOC142331765 [Lycorma delicatula]|uniref:uncharacterized protein LOC142331765 n=1 Tax=Lycorma delicatula TaxID=130591 RepID=UPI003F516CEE